MQGTDELIVADYDNKRVRSLDLSIANGVTSLVAGSGQLRSYDNNQSTQKAFSATFGALSDVDIFGDNMYFTELTGDEVQKVNMKTGEVTSIARRSTSNSYEGSPTNTNLDYPQTIVVDADGLYIAQTGTNRTADANSGCLLSYLNQSGSSVVKNGTTVPADYLSILGGDFIQGCRPWDPTYNGAQVRDVVLRQTVDSAK